MQKQKSTNLHDFDHELFLGFIGEQPLKKTEIDISYIGGQPLWLYQPKEKLFLCNDCSSEGETLTFLGQIFCPLNAKHCYNRIMYLFYCEKCRRTFKCIKQQTDQNWQPLTQQKKSQKKYRSISQQSFEIESDAIERKQLLKIMNRSKIQVEEQIILQEQGENDEDEQEGQQVVTVEKMTGQEMINKLAQIEKAKKNREYTEKEIQEINRKFQALKMQEKQEKQQMASKQIAGNKKDHVFQQYVRTIKALNNPVMIYSNVAVPYNKSPLNPKHTCKFCNSKLELEIQLTEKILLCSKSLAILDWGSIFIYACTASCQQSEQQCVVSQYEFDAVSQEQITKLKKTKKNRKKNKNKSLSKQKRRHQKQGEMKEIEPKIISSKKEQNQNKDASEQEGDWD